MDAHVFRRFCDALVVLLPGARLEKIQSPAADVHLFTFYAQQRKQLLALRHDRRNPYICISEEGHSTGQHPPATVMRLRKYAAGRRVKACVPEWAARRVHLCFQTAPPDAALAELQPETWLSLDLRLGPVLTLGSTPTLDSPPLWPSAQEATASCLSPDSAAWRQWPVLTPALRRTLAQLDALDQAALLADLEAGGGDIFTYTAEGGDAPNDCPQTECFAWPLPPALRGKRREQTWADPLAALAPVGTAVVLGGLARAEQRAAATPHNREAKRLTRVLEKLEREETRLRALLHGKEQALYLQSVLWRFPPEARPDRLIAALALAAEETVEGTAKRLPPCPFDPRLLHGQWSLRQHMEALFHGAARGARGLAMLEQRRALLRGQVAAAQDSALLSAASNAAMPPQGPPLGAAKSSGPTLAASPRILPKNVEAFTSVDGLIILRGKDARGNLALLKLGAPTDLWLHVAGGPGAHTLVRRAFVGQDVPQATLEQAATLAALKSWQKGNEKVEVQCAQLRHVKPMRGTAAGTVRIDKIERMVWVELPLG